MTEEIDITDQTITELLDQMRELGKFTDGEVERVEKIAQKVQSMERRFEDDNEKYGVYQIALDIVTIVGNPMNVKLFLKFAKLSEEEGIDW